MSESSFYLNANPIKCRFTIPRSQTLPQAALKGPLPVSSIQMKLEQPKKRVGQAFGINQNHSHYACLRRLNIFLSMT